MGKNIAVVEGSKRYAAHGTQHRYPVLSIIRAKKREAGEHSVLDVSKNMNQSIKHRPIPIMLRLWNLNPKSSSHSRQPTLVTLMQKIRSVCSRANLISCRNIFWKPLKTGKRKWSWGCAPCGYLAGPLAVREWLCP